MSLVNGFFVSSLTVKEYDTRQDMGRNAAIDMARKLRTVIAERGEANVVFAAAPSQNDFLEALIHIDGIDWTKVNAFHMDEYIGLPAEAPQSFGKFLREHIFDKLPFKSVNYINGNAANVEEECKRYSELLAKNKTDIVCLGIGENGHIAFNDPWVADFADLRTVKKVELDEICRNQQVNDGCFARIQDVPKYALTLTVPALMSGGSLFCVVPCRTKAKAVKSMLRGEIEEACPASVLRRHVDAVLYCDKESASLLD